MTYKDYLMHFGTLGMHWGERNGPPYPLSYRQMNSEQRRLRRRSYAVAGSNNASENAKQKNNSVDTAKPERSKTPVFGNRIDNKSLDEAIKRRDNEKKYRELQEKSIENGASFAKAMLSKLGTTIVTGIVVGVGKGVADKVTKLINSNIKIKTKAKTNTKSN